MPAHSRPRSRWQAASGYLLAPTYRYSPLCAGIEPHKTFGKGAGPGEGQPSPETPPIPNSFFELFSDNHKLLSETIIICSREEVGRRGRPTSFSSACSRGKAE